MHVVQHRGSLGDSGSQLLHQGLGVLEEGP
jgi:hypothetical protein